jgi:hypothetical protein
VKIIDYALALDGGTQVVVLEDDDGRQITFGRDGRMGIPESSRQLFFGGAPDAADARRLAIGSTEEAELVALMERWLDTTQGFLRREALLDADPETLNGQDLLDRMALELYLEIRQRNKVT